MILRLGPTIWTFSGLVFASFVLRVKIIVGEDSTQDEMNLSRSYFKWKNNSSRYGSFVCVWFARFLFNPLSLYRVYQEKSDWNKRQNVNRQYLYNLYKIGRFRQISHDILVFAWLYYFIEFHNFTLISTFSSDFSALLVLGWFSFNFLSLGWVGQIWSDFAWFFCFRLIFIKFLQISNYLLV